MEIKSTGYLKIECFPKGVQITGNLEIRDYVDIVKIIHGIYVALGLADDKIVDFSKLLVEFASCGYTAVNMSAIEKATQGRQRGWQE